MPFPVLPTVVVNVSSATAVDEVGFLLHERDVFLQVDFNGKLRWGWEKSGTWMNLFFAFNSQIFRYSFTSFFSSLNLCRSMHILCVCSKLLRLRAFKALAPPHRMKKGRNRLVTRYHGSLRTFNQTHPLPSSPPFRFFFAFSTRVHLNRESSTPIFLKTLF